MSSRKPKAELKHPRAKSIDDPKRICFSVEKTVWDKLVRLAKREERSLDAHLRRLVTGYVKDQENRGVFNE